jgi:hypothetical protein
MPQTIRKLRTKGIVKDIPAITPESTLFNHKGIESTPTKRIARICRFKITPSTIVEGEALVRFGIFKD